MQKAAFQPVYLLILTVILWSCGPHRRPEVVTQHTILNDSGTLVINFGNGKFLYQKYRIHGDSIFSRILTVSDQQSLSESWGIFSQDGTLDSIYLKTYQPSDSGQWNVSEEFAVRVRRDSVFLVAGDKQYYVNSRLSDREFEIRVNNKVCYTPYPLAGLIAENVMDSSIIRQIHGSSPLILNVNSSKSDTFPNVLNTGERVVLFVNTNGALDSIKGENDLFPISGIVYRNLNFDSLLLANAPRKRIIKKYSVTKIDTLVFKNGDLSVRIKYEQPEYHGKKIFGNEVPYGKIWITGVDTAAEFSINQPVSFYGQQLDKGNYSLLTIPRKDLWMLILNRKTGISPGEYNPEYDVFRVPMKVDSLAEDVKQLTINIMPFETGGVLSIKWENTGAVVMFK